MPTQEQISFFERWNEAARREDRAADLAKTMSQRMEEALRLSALATELNEAVTRDRGDVRSG